MLRSMTTVFSAPLQAAAGVLMPARPALPDRHVEVCVSAMSAMGSGTTSMSPAPVVSPRLQAILASDASDDAAGLHAERDGGSRGLAQPTKRALQKFCGLISIQIPFPQDTPQPAGLSPNAGELRNSALRFKAGAGRRA